MHNEKKPKRVLIGAVKTTNDWCADFLNIIEVNVIEFSPSGKYLKGASSKDVSYERWYDMEAEYKLLEVLE